MAAELGAATSLNNQNQLSIRGVYNPRQIQSLLVKYTKEYVVCGVCKSTQTSMVRDPVTRLTFLTCSACTSKRAVANIQAGFHAQTRKDRKEARDH